MIAIGGSTITTAANIPQTQQHISCVVSAQTRKRSSSGWLRAINRSWFVALVVPGVLVIVRLEGGKGGTARGHVLLC